MQRSDPLLPPDPTPPTPGGRRLGNIELQRVLTTSAHAVVHQAWDHALGRPVVVEEYFPPALARHDADGRVHPLGPETAERFEQGRAWFVDAWRTLGQCDHPSLLRVLLLLEAYGTAYAVTPPQTGNALADQTAAFPLDEFSLRALLDDLLGALETYHRSGRPHGDIGPATVRWQPGGRALLVSPGAVQPAGDDGAPCGAPAAAADLHALALLARFCITGTLPAPHAPGAPEPLSTAIERLGFEALAARYGADLATLLQRASAPDPAQWPESVAQFRAAMGAAAPNPPPRAAPAPPSRMAPAQPPPVAVPQTAPPPTAARPDEPAFDAPTAEHIQRVLHSFAEPGDRARRPRRPPPVGDGAAFARTSSYTLPPEDEPRRWPLWLGLAVVAAVFGIGAWQADRRPPEGVRIAGSPPAPLPAASAPAGPADAPATPPAALPEPPRAALEPETAPPTSAGPMASDEPAPTAAVEPAAPSPPPAKPPRTRPARAAPAPTTPRATCGPRTQFSLYRCMQQLCSTARWRAHPECARLRATDSVD